MSKRWYVVQTYSGFENSVREDLESRKDSMGLQNKIYQVLVPEEEVEVVDKKNVKKTKLVKMFPGYIFLEMEVDGEIDNDTWYVIRNTQKVTGFLGSSGGGTKPVPIPQDEMNRILQKIGKLEAAKFDIHVGDSVEIVSGIFAGQVGVVSSINEEKEELVVMIEMFGGRATPNELKFTDVKKIG